MSTCFIIMPITTPEHLIPIYSDDSDHFDHVLNHLFIPAIEKAKFTPIAPVAKGADLIQAEIIKYDVPLIFRYLKKIQFISVRIWTHIVHKHTHPLQLTLKSLDFDFGIFIAVI